MRCKWVGSAGWEALGRLLAFGWMGGLDLGGWVGLDKCVVFLSG